MGRRRSYHDLGNRDQAASLLELCLASYAVDLRDILDDVWQEPGRVETSEATFSDERAAESPSQSEPPGSEEYDSIGMRGAIREWGEFRASSGGAAGHSPLGTTRKNGGLDGT